MAKLNFGGVEENVVTREEFPLSKAQEVLKNETVAVIGYGVQGPGQALNQKDNGINVIVGQRKNSKTWVLKYTLIYRQKTNKILLNNQVFSYIWMQNKLIKH